MSLSVFKQNLIQYMDAKPNTSDDFAEFLVREYDVLIKGGFDMLNQVPLQTGNTQTMESLLKAFLTMNNYKKEGQLSIGDWGPAFKGYWMGAQGALFPLPVIPAPGTLQNLQTQTHIIVNPGEWSIDLPTPPVLKTESFVEILTLAIQTHIMTVQGLIITLSLYPVAPTPVPGPGVINWTGYSVPQ
tara:strand:+ start:1562 stop:2119 length:558 start_codon:yes stop_codon:yes gene_type:complete